MTTELLHLPLDQIDPGFERARYIDPDWVQALAALIREQGLTNPISVRHAGEGYRLVTGLHRLEAFKLLEAEEIPATLSMAATDDEARLEEVMENLGRNELKALDRCHHLYELKQVWGRMYPETGHGGDRKSDNIKRPKWSLDQGGPEIFGFAKATAEKIGLSQTAIKRDVAIWKNLSEASRRSLSDMAMANKMTELKALSVEKHPSQSAILDLILDPGHPDIQNVAEAIFHLDNGVTPNAIERRFMAVSKSVGALDDQTFDHVIMAHEGRVIASLKRRGRI